MKRLFPTRAEWNTLFGLLSKRERAAFLFFFLLAWISATLIFVRIDRLHSTQVPAYGGSLTEGIVGIPTKINPLIAISDADRDLTRVVYSGLMKSDGHGGLAPDLAERFEISPDGLTYTFFLKDNLYWHDNTRLTADDVAFTITLAKNPKIDSPKRANWEGVTPEVAGDREIRFHLRKPYAPFLENTTIGILPKHVWEKVAIEEFRLSTFNLEPVGSGPFLIKSVNRNADDTIASYELARFNRYQPASAYLDALTFMFYPSARELRAALENGDVEAAATSLAEPMDGYTEHLPKLPRIFSVFFNQDKFLASKEQKVREALSIAVDRARIIQEVEQGRAIPTTSPIPPGTFGYAPELDKPAYDLDRARALLDEAGYKDSDGDGIREKTVKKETTTLRFTISTSNTPQLVQSAELLRSMWKEIGVDAAVHTYEIGDLEQSIIRPRNYDALLFGQVVGYDPDPFAFWHASQRNDLGLNVALYANPTVNKLLEDARVTTDSEKRSALYATFQEELAKDRPAVFLYSPLYAYTVPSELKGIDLQQIPLPQERFSNIAKWHVNTKSVWNILLR